MTSLSGKRILLVIGGGIAAYKALELIRRLRKRGAVVVPVMTAAAAEFVTPLSVGALSASRVYSDLFDREDEQDVGHIRLARGCDAVVVAPATADRMARLAAGLAEDLAGAVQAAPHSRLGDIDDLRDAFAWHAFQLVEHEYCSVTLRKASQRCFHAAPNDFVGQGRAGDQRGRRREGQHSRQRLSQALAPTHAAGLGDADPE